jgi:hypothetical protein
MAPRCGYPQSVTRLIHWMTCSPKRHAAPR